MDISKRTLTYRLGYEYAGRLLVPYVIWCIQSAMVSGYEHLYFVARDGFYLKKIADKYIDDNGLKLTTEYVYSSRLAWKRAYCGKNIINFNELIKCEPFFNLDEIVYFLDINKSDVSKLIPKLLRDKKYYTDFERRIVITSLFSDAKFVNKCYEKLHYHYLNAERYLKQTIRYLDKFAFVEVNGTGVTQDLLQTMLSDWGYSDFTSYYFYHWGRMEGYKSKTRFVSFFEKWPEEHIIIELFTRAPHGYTVGYQVKDNGDAQPVLTNLIEGFASIRDFKDYEDGILNSIGYNQGISRDNIDEVINEVIEFKDKLLHDTIGEMQFADDNWSRTTRCYAPLLTLQDAKYITNGNRFREQWREKFNGINLDFSIKRSDEEVGKWFGTHFSEEKNLPVDMSESVPIQYGNIVIYGAGTRGKKFYSFYRNHPDVIVLLWVDSNYMSIDDSRVVNPELISQVEFDFIVIAIADKELNNQVKSQLIALGIDENKIC